tara:strand:+ start:422 stop:694 length:273 start_codon:yes stop_codon:yes gene_type:complete
MFFKKKIKETPKARLYGNRYNQKNDFSAWDSMSIIEQIVMIVMPCLLAFLFYIMLEMTGLIWWVRLIISIGMVGGFIGLITLIINILTEV